MKSRRDLDCLVAGEANVDLLVEGVVELEMDKEKLATRADLLLGGSSSITAFNLARLGARVGFVGVVGDDVFGKFVSERLESAGLKMVALRRMREAGTGLTIWHYRGNQRGGITYPGTIALLRAKDVSGVYLRRARHLHVGAYFLLTQLHAGAAGLFRRAKKLGLTTSLDCNYDPAEQWDSGIGEVLRHTDVFFPNETEARCLTGRESPEEAAVELAKLARIAVVKCGARGAVVCSEGSSFRMPAKKARVVDTTGAGDSFNAGFLSRFVRGASLRECAKAGVAAGARSVTRVGGTAAFED